MTVFKTFLKILNRCKGLVIMYIAMVVFFGGLNITANDTATSFEEVKPDIFVINNDTETGITAGLIDYLKEHGELADIEDADTAVSDALFYRDVNYVINIPENFNNDMLAGKAPEIEIRSTNDYPAYYAQMLLEKYVSTAQAYIKISEGDDVDNILENINSTLKTQAETEITSKLNTQKISKTTTYFNFMNYGLLAGAIFTICTVLYAFNEKNVHKRTMVSPINIKKYNRTLLLANGIFAAALWILYNIAAFILCGSDVMTTGHGLVFMLNSLVFTICTLSIAFLIANIVQSKNAVNGIVNVLALGSSFLCGAFVPSEYLPESVLNAAHILPSYWYINTNDRLKDIEIIDFESLKPLLVNMGVVLAFSVLFVIITNIISSKKRT